VEKWELSAATVAMLPSLELSPAQAVPTADASSAFAVLNYHISHLMGGEPRLAETLVPARRRRQG
jgi:hypothetical protein